MRDTLGDLRRLLYSTIYPVSQLSEQFYWGQILSAFGSWNLLIGLISFLRVCIAKITKEISHSLKYLIIFSCRFLLHSSPRILGLCRGVPGVKNWKETSLGGLEPPTFRLTAVMRYRLSFLNENEMRNDTVELLWKNNVKKRRYGFETVIFFTVI